MASTDNAFTDVPVKGLFPIGSTVVDHVGWRSNTITVRERAMLMFMNSVTDKPDWARKVHDETIVAKWKAELADMVAQAQAGTTRPSQGGSILANGFSDAMFGYCIRELRDKAAVYNTTADEDGKGGIAVVLDTAAAVFKADGRVPDAVRDALLAAVKVFEGQEKDWHPGSDGKVLDLVHPSLWPLVYGTTSQLSYEVGLEDALEVIGSGEVVPVPTSQSLGLGKPSSQRLWSERFQWLPCEVSFGEDGAQPAKVTSYINNAHPVEHAALYPVVGRLLDLSLPMLQAAYDRVMSWPHEEPFHPAELSDAVEARKRINCTDSNRVCTVPEICGDRCLGTNVPRSEYPEDWDGQRDYTVEEAWFNRVHVVQQPEPQAYGSLPSIKIRTTGPWFPSAARRPIGPLSKTEVAEQELRYKAKTKKVEERKAADNARLEEYRAALQKHRVRVTEAIARGEDAPPGPQYVQEVRVRPATPVDDEDVPVPIDSRLQVIVKLANIHLTPEKPSYSGGSWHFEGQLNEHIIGTVLYYFDVDNVTESRLAFRSQCDAEDFHEGGFTYEQNDHEPFEILYGVSPGWDDPTVQTIGDVVTNEGRLLVFPNVLQHQVQSFELADKTRPGHRKIVALFLVDPAVRIPSTATVPPQQQHWRKESAVDANLPPELSRMIYDNLTVPYSLDKAKALREELIEERKAIDQTVQEVINETTWCFCEH